MDALRDWRKQKKWTQAELAKHMGIDKHQISRWEHGKYPPSRMAKELLRRVGFRVPE